MIFLAIFNHPNDSYLQAEAGISVLYYFFFIIVAALHNLACDESSRIAIQSDKLFGLRMILRTMQLSPDSMEIQQRCLRLLRNLCHSAPPYLQRRMVIGDPPDFYYPLPLPPVIPPIYEIPSEPEIIMSIDNIFSGNIETSDDDDKHDLEVLDQTQFEVVDLHGLEQALPEILSEIDVNDATSTIISPNSKRSFPSYKLDLLIAAFRETYDEQKSNPQFESIRQTSDSSSIPSEYHTHRISSLSTPISILPSSLNLARDTSSSSIYSNSTFDFPPVPQCLNQRTTYSSNVSNLISSKYLYQF